MLFKLFLTGVISAGLVVQSHGADHLLTIGGGPNAKNNQLSLENNFRYLQRTIEKLRITGLEQRLLFSDGGAPFRDLQYEGARDPEDILSLLADVLGQDDGAKLDYRSSNLPVVDGSADRSSVEETLRRYSLELSSGDRLIIYFTGHGGPGHTPRGRPSSFPSELSSDAGEEIASDKQTTAPIIRSQLVSTTIQSDESGPNESVPQRGAGDEFDRRREGRFPQRGGGPRGRGRDVYSNNVLHLWNDTDLPVRDWTASLDAMSNDVPVIAIMVQCYSGGFGNFIFKGGIPANGLASQPRCGFFSTVPDRVASGCTPAVDEAEYREYSSYFFEALSGESRTGQPVEMPDYDGDGKTSLLEAHAYTVIHSDTIDIPVKSSDIFLRNYRRGNGVPPGPGGRGASSLTSKSPIGELIAIASPVERAVIKALSEAFSLTGDDRAHDVETAIADLKAKEQALERELRVARNNLSSAKRSIRDKVMKRWPELSSPWHPEFARILSQEAQALKDVILNDARYQEMLQSEKEVRRLQKLNENYEQQVVKLERLAYWLETVALKGSLSEEQSKKDLARILELESAFLVENASIASSGG